MKVLFVDDEKVSLEIFRQMYEKYTGKNEEAEFAGSGGEALEMINKNCFDVVITDLLMPEVSGIDLLKKIREKNRFTEVIIVSAADSVKTAVEAMKQGARDYLLKPVNPDDLFSKLDNISELKSIYSEMENYRYAKEKLEDHACCSLNECEIRLNGLYQIIDRIEKECGKDSPSDEKIDRIINIIKSFEDSSNSKKNDSENK